MGFSYTNKLFKWAWRTFVEFWEIKIFYGMRIGNHSYKSRYWIRCKWEMCQVRHLYKCFDYEVFRKSSSLGSRSNDMELRWNKSGLDVINVKTTSLLQLVYMLLYSTLMSCCMWFSQFWEEVKGISIFTTIKLLWMTKWKLRFN